VVEERMSGDKKKPDEVVPFGAVTSKIGSTYETNVADSQVAGIAIGERAITIVNQGLSFTEAERLFGLLFEQNFPKLRAAAQAEAKRRVEEFAATFTRVAAEKKVTEEQLQSIEEPDVQFSLNEALQVAARRDNDLVRGILARLIAQRLQTERDDAKDLLFSEAVVAVSRLSTGQLKTIVLCFLVREHTFKIDPPTWPGFNEVLERKFKPFLDVRSSNADLERIEHLGCGTIDMELAPLSRIWSQQYGRIFGEDVVFPYNIGNFEGILRRKSPIGALVADTWERLRLNLLRLTRLGVVVAATSCEQLLQEKLSLNDWIR
jgi:hypothetical protein